MRWIIVAMLFAACKTYRTTNGEFEIIEPTDSVDTGDVQE